MVSGVTLGLQLNSIYMFDQAPADDGFERSPSGSGSRRYL